MNTILQYSKKWLLSRYALGILGLGTLTSCTVQSGGYTETDGVYYDPETDTLPQGTVYSHGGNRVGDVYDYDYEGYEEEDDDIGYRPGEKRYGKYKRVTDSDWGTYTGTEQIYSGWGYSPRGMWPGMGFGWGNRFGWSFGMNWGWGSPWYGNGFYDPFWYGGWNSPVFGYHPWYGWGNPYWGGVYQPVYVQRLPHMNSGAVGRIGNSYNPQAFSNRNSTYRPSGNMSGERRTSGFRNSVNTDRNRTYDHRGTESRSSGGFRNSYPSQDRRMSRPETYSAPSRSYNPGGFRNSTGSMPSSGGGGFRSGGFR